MKINFHLTESWKPVDDSSTVEKFFSQERDAIKYLLGSFYERLGEFSGSSHSVLFFPTIVDCFVGHKSQLKWSLKSKMY